MRKNIIYTKTVPQKEASYAPYPEKLAMSLQEYLKTRGIKQLYCHQSEMFEEVEKKNNVVITTSTASGKTLSFLLPVVQQILKDPLTRAIFIYPTKALASDQYRAMQPLLDYLGKTRISAGIYDGDTPVNERSRIRNSANIILTNPEMLNSAFLPHHSNYGFDFIFSNLKFVVIDELHSYKGAFGSHLANIFRRLYRVCKYYNSSVQFLCSSATIANPIELAENICGGEFVCINQDGSPTPEKLYHIIQPPIIGKNRFREEITSVAANLLPELIIEHRSLIAFCKSRRSVEIVLKEARDKLKFDGVKGQDKSYLISGYRGGYTPEERKQIENKMVSGTLSALVSTNALELGIDIGKVDTTVLTGYPGTKASFRQQSGRAGRLGQNAENFLILDSEPFDQYIAIDPEWLFDEKSENAVIDKNNLFIQIAHLRAAAAELPLSLDDVTIFPDLGEVVPVLLKANEVTSVNGKFAWCGSDFPAGDYSLRNMDNERYKLVDIDTGKLITELDEVQAFREIHPGAIYLHDGRMYQIMNLDLEQRKGLGKAINDNYYTVPCERTKVSIINEQNDSDLGRTKSHFGDIEVTTVISSYKKLQFHNHQNLGFENLAIPLSKTFETEGIWIDLPQEVCDLFRKLVQENIENRQTDLYNSYLSGLSYTIFISTMMTTMTERNDIGYGFILNISSDTNKVAICIYDLFVGGLGYAEKAFEVIDLIVKNAIRRVENCKCKNGCPVCIGDHRIDKKVVLWALNSIYKKLREPRKIKNSVAAPQPILEKPFQLSELKDKWAKFIELIGQKGEYLSGFISMIYNVEITEQGLILFLEDNFYKHWLEEKENKLKLYNLLTAYVEVPTHFEIAIEVIKKEASANEEKIMKRFTELRK